jgi:hypothetical protein
LGLAPLAQVHAAVGVIGRGGTQRCATGIIAARYVGLGSGVGSGSGSSSGIGSGSGSGSGIGSGSGSGSGIAASKARRIRLGLRICSGLQRTATVLTSRHGQGQGSNGPQRQLVR